MNLDEFIKNRTTQLEKNLIVEVKNWQKEVLKLNPELKKLTNSFIKSCQGGKLLRGLLVELGFEIAANSFSENLINKNLLKPAIAYEIFHSSILIHDDIIDQSPTRRGIETLYKRLGGSHYGISQAISLGDLGFFLSIKKLIEAEFNEKFKSKALVYFSKVIMDTTLGEILDVEAPNFPEKYKSTDVKNIYTLKTARYSICGPLILGAILAGAEGKLIRNLEEFGLNLGLAYQIQDDYLGVFGEEKTTGKSISSDIEEGKSTLLISLAFLNATSKQKIILNSLYGKKGIKKEEIKLIKEVFLETGALDYSKKEIKKYTQKAISVIPEITDDLKVREVLDSFANYLVERNK